MKKPTTPSNVTVDVRAGARLRVKKHREALTARGYKPVTRWVLNLEDPAVLAEIRQQCLALRGDPAEKEALDFIEHAMDYTGWV